MVAHPGGEVADLCVCNFAPLCSTSSNTMVAQVSLLSSANMTFQERSRICRKKPNWFKLLSDLVQTRLAGGSAWEVLLSHANTKVEIIALCYKLEKASFWWFVLFVCWIFSLSPYGWPRLMWSVRFNQWVEAGKLRNKVRGNLQWDLWGFLSEGRDVGRSNGASVWKYPTTTRHSDRLNLKHRPLWCFMSCMDSF